MTQEEPLTRAAITAHEARTHVELVAELQVIAIVAGGTFLAHAFPNQGPSNNVIHLSSCVDVLLNAQSDSVH
jgi:hypothetical protein